MKILRIKFNNILIFNEVFDIDFTAADKVFDYSGAHTIYKPIYTNQTIGIVGINASGKSTSLRLINLAMEVVLKGTPLSNDLVPSMFINDAVEKNGVVMEVYFTKGEEVFNLRSLIKMRYNLENRAEFYFEDEVIRRKPLKSVKNKNSIFIFDENTKSYVRSGLPKETLEFLQDNFSIAISVSERQLISVHSMMDYIIDKYVYVQGNVDEKILKVFDENIEMLERTKDNQLKVKFKNTDSQIESHVLSQDDLISSGTLRGQRIIKNAITALRSGGYLLVDELENHLNKELVKMIIKIFNDKNINKKGACLVFTTHYAEILDSFDRMDNIYVLTRGKNLLTKINRYSDMVSRNILKKSEVILSNYIKGTAPKAGSITDLEEYICLETSKNP